MVLGFSAVGAAFAPELLTYSDISVDTLSLVFWSAAAILFPLVASQLVFVPKDSRPNAITTVLGFLALSALTPWLLELDESFPLPFCYLVGIFLSSVFINALLYRFWPRAIGLPFKRAGQTIGRQFRLSNAFIWLTLVSLIVGLAKQVEFFSFDEIGMLTLLCLAMFLIGVVANCLIVIPLTAFLAQAKPSALASMSAIVLSFPLALAFAYTFIYTRDGGFIFDEEKVFYWQLIFVTASRVQALVFRIRFVFTVCHWFPVVVSQYLILANCLSPPLRSGRATF